MNTDKIVNEILAPLKQGRLRLDLDNASLISPDNHEISLNLPAFVESRNNKLLLTIRASGLNKVEKDILKVIDLGSRESDVYHRKDLFSLRALAHNGLVVLLDCLIPNNTNHISVGGNKVHTYTMKCERIHILPTDLESMTSTDFHALLNSTPTADSNNVPPEPTQKSIITAAMLPNVKFTLGNKGSTIKESSPRWKERTRTSVTYTDGQILNGRYLLEALGDDVLVKFQTELQQNPCAEVSAEAVLDGLLQAFGFTQSCQPWPYFRYEEHGSQMVLRWCRSPQDCQRSMYLPFKSKWVFEPNATNSLFEMAAAYFATNKPHGPLFKRILWLCREACREGIAPAVKLLTLCSALEGVLFRLAPEAIRKMEASTQNKWRLAFEHLALDWAGTFKQVFENWRYYRNVLAHGFGTRSDDESDPLRATFAACQITGTIYALMAQEFGYKGRIVLSELEGTVLEIS